ncbi:MAG: hypothetical protein Q7R52_02500 [archaeon]|nr:hypothetical protein [archaeon]
MTNYSKIKQRSDNIFLNDVALLNLGKNELIGKLKNNVFHYNNLKNIYLEQCIENEYLKRRVRQLEAQNKILNKSGIHRNFKHLRTSNRIKKKSNI